MSIPVVQIVGYKNSGKTTLIEQLIGRLTEKGYTVGAIKHDAHQFETDHPGTDTWRHRKAGAHITAITSEHRTAIVEEKHTPLNELLQRMTSMDIVLVEGFKHEPYPKIVVVRSEEDKALVRSLHNVVAVSSWVAGLKYNVPVYAIGDFEGVAEWIQQNLHECRST